MWLADPLTSCGPHRTAPATQRQRADSPGTRGSVFSPGPSTNTQRPFCRKSSSWKMLRKSSNGALWTAPADPSRSGPGRTTTNSSRPCAPWGMPLTAVSLWPLIMEHQPPENGGMPYLGGTCALLSGQHARIARMAETAQRNGSPVGTSLTGLTWGDLFSTGPNLWRMPPCAALRMATASMLWKTPPRTS